MNPKNPGIHESTVSFSIFFHVWKYDRLCLCDAEEYPSHLILQLCLDQAKHLAIDCMTRLIYALVPKHIWIAGKI